MERDDASITESQDPDDEQHEFGPKEQAEAKRGAEAGRSRGERRRHKEAGRSQGERRRQKEVTLVV